jgi:non-ribosomal peptide synthetase component E (peptide arylation enzyme)
MLDGVTPSPAEFAGRYRDRGYWADRPLFDGFTGALGRYADRVPLVDGPSSATTPPSWTWSSTPAPSVFSGSGALGL